MTISKDCPLTTGLFDYFPNILAAVSRLAVLGNMKHNPGEPLHWAFDKSTAHADSLARHLFQRGLTDPETGMSHTVNLVIRALMLGETELIQAGATPGRGVRLTSPPPDDVLTFTPADAVLPSRPLSEQLIAAGYDRFSALKAEE